MLHRSAEAQPPIREMLNTANAWLFHVLVPRRMIVPTSGPSAIAPAKHTE